MTIPPCRDREPGILFSRMIRGRRTGTRAPLGDADRLQSPSAKAGSTLRTVCGQDIAQLCKSCSFLLTGEGLECEENGLFEAFSCSKVAERMGFEISFYRLFHWFYGLKPTLRLLAAATVVMVISAQST